jgi:peptide/nickel transport system ATP-binding protein/oligopeptide transport system ATP-binding protein
VLLRVEKLGKTFDGPARLPFVQARSGVRAVDGVTFGVGRGETLAVVGESGCGKSTLGRLLLRLIEPSDGQVFFEGRDIAALSARAMREVRRQAQMVFQDPYGSLSPRGTVAQIVAEPLEVFGRATGRRAMRDRVAELLTQVGLPAAAMDRHPQLFRRPAPAHRHCARHRRGAELHRLRRAGERARRLGAGADRQPAPGSAGGAWLLLSLHRA